MAKFSRAFKLAALARMERAPDVSALARELGVSRVQLYRWRWAWEAGGAAALRAAGRRRGGTAGLQEALAADVLAAARERIDELERKIGQQQLDLDFFRRALRQVEALRRPSDGPGAMASTPSSRR